MRAHYYVTGQRTSICGIGKLRESAKSPQARRREMCATCWEMLCEQLKTEFV